ncbi:MAG: DUF4381 domain-containing protein [Alphaproteobacteria bacterium]|nr:DUF4381 domain-containing protein [Alphaproteobacteria bacterium]
MFLRLNLFLLLSVFSLSASSKEPDLSGLKDVILGEKPSLFPLPIGWWCIIGSILVIILISAFIAKRKLFPSAYFYTQAEIKKLKKQNLTPVQTGKELSKILKRVAILKFGQEQVASLSHQDWKKFLQNKSHDPKQTKEIDFISKAAFLPPEKDVAISNKSLYTYAEKWVKTVLKGK